MENDDFENEIWLPIADFPNYQISNFGRVKSLNYRQTSEEQILKPKKCTSGYLSVGLCKNGKTKQILVHRLVALHFIQNNDIFKTQINHINEIKTDNRVQNLEWCDKSYNINYGTRNEKDSKSQPNRKQVNQYDLTGNFIKTWKSLHEIQRQLGYFFSNISNCCNGRCKSAYGFIWRFNEN